MSELEYKQMRMLVLGESEDQADRIAAEFLRAKQTK
jgi:hypothetical protein